MTQFDIFILYGGVYMIFETFASFMNKIMLFSSYINNSYGYPKPLTPLEEKNYLQRYWEGDEIAKEKLINHNLRLVAHIVKKYSNSTYEAEDMISVGTIGLIKAVNTFSKDKNTQLSTYAARCIENEILMLLRKQKKHKSVASLNEALGKDKDGNDICLMDIIDDQEDNVELKVENKIFIDKVLKITKQYLNQREYEIIVMRYGLNGNKPLTQLEVAKKLGISRSYISRLEKKALKTISSHALPYKDF